MRTFFIWFFGLTAGSSIGAMIGSATQSSDGGFLGFVGGLAVFACLRLWLAPRQVA